jgi:hypothetical protein
VGCPNGDALVTFLYDEFEPGSVPDRRQISRHLRECTICAAEVEALGGVRAQLPAWVAPELEAGFRVVQEPVRGAGWRRAFGFFEGGWLQPVVPYAAATIVLGAALALARLDVQYGASGLQVRTGWGHAAASPTAPVADRAATVQASSVADLRAEVESLRRDLRRTQSTTSAPVVATSLGVTPAVQATPTATNASSDAAVLRRLRQLIDESEMRQQQNLQLRISEIARDFRLVRQADMVQVEQGFSRLAGQRQQDAAEQKRLFDALRNVSVQGRPPQ